MKHFLTVEGVIAAQTPKIEPVFRSILGEFNTIIEIGFDRGALSLWLYNNKNLDTKLVSYDISFKNKLVNHSSIDFRLGDCFDQKIITEISELIKSKGKTLVLCDGGSKEREFEVYSEFLKVGDVIMLHDYAHSTDDYRIIQTELNWTTDAESKFENIQTAINSNNLVPYNYEMFKSVLWGAFIKQS